MSKLGIWIISLFVGLGAWQVLAHKSDHINHPGERSQHTADYDSDDEDPIYWEHDDDEGGPWGEVLISARESRIIRDFYETWQPGPHTRRSPPPFLKSEAWFGGELPPNWRARVQKQRIIPTEIYAGSYSVPAELIRQLPPQPAGSYLVETGNRISRTYNETRRVADFVDY